MAWGTGVPSAPLMNPRIPLPPSGWGAPADAYTVCWTGASPESWDGACAEARVAANPLNAAGASAPTDTSSWVSRCWA